MLPVQVHMQYLEAGADIIISSSYQVLPVAFIFRTIDIDQILQFMVVLMFRTSNVTYCIVHTRFFACRQQSRVSWLEECLLMRRKIYWEQV